MAAAVAGQTPRGPSPEQQTCGARHLPSSPQTMTEVRKSRMGQTGGNSPEPGTATPALSQPGGAQAGAHMPALPSSASTCGRGPASCHPPLPHPAGGRTPLAPRSPSGRPHPGPRSRPFEDQALLPSPSIPALPPPSSG